MARQPDDPWDVLTGEPLSMKDFKASWKTTPAWVKYLLGGLLVLALLGFIF